MEAARYLDDIPQDVARRAFLWLSHDPEGRGDRSRMEYASTLAQDFAELEKYATTDEKREILSAQFARYRAGYRERTLGFLHSESRCASAFICGPSNFPTRMMEKRHGYSEKRLADLLDYRGRALKAIKRALQPERRPIMLSDDNAGDRLAAKLASAEKLQAAMLAANKAIRANAKGGTVAQTAALLALGFSDTRAHQLLTPNYCGRVGFEGWQLTNNSAEIRRIKARMAKVDEIRTTPGTATECENARIEDCPAENRIRLYFPGKPSGDTIAALKRHGFRWAPSLGCWQAYRNWNAQEFATQAAGAPVQTDAIEDADVSGDPCAELDEPIPEDEIEDTEEEAQPEPQRDPAGGLRGQMALAFGEPLVLV